MSQGKVVILGCGLIGTSWAALFVANGYDVYAWDPDAEATASLAERVKRPLAQLAELAAGKASGRGQLVSGLPLEKTVAGAFLVQENAPENVQLKRALFAEVEKAAAADTIIASSTSSLVWSDLGQDMVNPARFVTAHPFNPPHLMPLVELYGRDPDILDRAEAFYHSLGRKTVRLRRDAVGHIANRLASALWREAVTLVAEGIADVSDIDAALVHGPGLRWSVVGAHMGYHLGGGPGGIEHYLRHLGPSQERRWATLGSPKLTPEVCEQLISGIEAEAEGRSIEELEVERDERLIAIMKHRNIP